MNVVQRTAWIGSAQGSPLSDERTTTGRSPCAVVDLDNALAASPFLVTAADRALEQAIKEALDALAYPFGFFRDYDEPNEIFAPRAADALPALAERIAALPIWPSIAKASGASAAE